MASNTVPPCCQNQCEWIVQQKKELLESFDYFKCISCEQIHVWYCSESPYELSDASYVNFSTLKCNSCVGSTFYRESFGNKHIKNRQ